MRPGHLRLATLTLLASPAAPAALAADGTTWQLASGPTRAQGGAVELSLTSGHWAAAIGYVGEQEVRVRTEQDLCYTVPAGLPDCVTTRTEARQPVNGYSYLSLERRFSIRPRFGLRPELGIGLAANSDRNPYVSSVFTFSLSAGIRLGERWALEWRHFSNAGLSSPNLGQDMVLLRAHFGGADRQPGR